MPTILIISWLVVITVVIVFIVISIHNIRKAIFRLADSLEDVTDINEAYNSCLRDLVKYFAAEGKIDFDFAVKLEKETVDSLAEVRERIEKRNAESS